MAAAANHLRRLAAAAAPALSRGSQQQHPRPLLRLALSSSAPTADRPAAAEGEDVARKGEAGSTEAVKAGDGASERKGDVEEEGEGGEPVNKPTEIGGPRGPEPTRYGDWERGGRCSDF